MATNTTNNVGLGLHHFCLWGPPNAPCNQGFTNEALLYQHLCAQHVGPPHGGNITLACLWHGCPGYAATIKRDHIASHLRTHVPGHRPYACQVNGCRKNYKRSQDLRKHERNYHGLP